MFKQKLSGELYIFLEAILWSLLPIIIILTMVSITPLFTAAISIFLSTIFFAIHLTIKKDWKQKTTLSTWKNILGTTIILGIIFYTLLFVGISHTSAGNAALILNMEVFLLWLSLGHSLSMRKSIKFKQSVLFSWL